MYGRGEREEKVEQRGEWEREREEVRGDMGRGTITPRLCLLKVPPLWTVLLVGDKAFSAWAFRGYCKSSPDKLSRDKYTWFSKAY